MIIALTGYSNSGKSTVSKYLVEQLNFIELSFSSALKDVVGQLFSWDRNLLEGTTPESRIWRETVDTKWSKSFNQPDLTPRKVLQTFGTNVIRNFQDDFWIKILENKIIDILNMNKDANIVITDARFLNEIAFIKSYGGTIYWVIRDLPVYHNEIVEAINSNGIPNIKVHRSEWEFLMEPKKIVVRNDGTLEDLETKLNFIFKN